MNFLSNIEEMIKRTKERQAKYDEKIIEVRKVQSETIRSLQTLANETEVLPPYE